jgi:glutamyl-tRNA reductase
MAAGATIHTFTVTLADVDRGVYEDLSLRVARHSSETDVYMLTRVLAYGLEFAEGIAFTEGISATDEPAVVIRDATGSLTGWIEVGAPEAARLHEGSMKAGRVAVYTHRDPQSVDHLFRVSCGIDSMVLGETEILGQLKQAYKLAHAEKATGALLNKTFQKAFNVAKLVRSETQIQRGSISVSSVAVELAESIFDSLKSRQVLVIGAGDTSEKAARALKSRGAQSVLVSNRSHDRAVALAAELDGRAVGFDTWEQEFKQVDIIISSTAAPHYVLTRDKLEGLLRQRGHRPLLLVDIAVPRDIDPDCNQLENVYVYNIDDLQGIAGQYLEQRKAELELCKRLIAKKRNELLDSLQAHPGNTNHGLREQQAGS